MLGVKLEQVNAKLGHAAARSQPCSFEITVLRLGFFQDGNVGVVVLPEGEEVKRGVPQLLDIAYQDDITVHSPACQNKLFAVVRPGEIKD